MTPLDFNVAIKSDHNFLVINHFPNTKSVTVNGFYQRKHADEFKCDFTVTILEL